MLNIDEIQNGVVIDHIKAGTSRTLADVAGLDSLDCGVAIIKNVRSTKSGKKDIIKVEGEVSSINFGVLAYIDPDITINYIKNGKIIKKEKPVLPETLVNVMRCKNPRCITSIEHECDHIFKLTASGKCRCLYCEEEFQKNKNLK